MSSYAASPRSPTSRGSPRSPTSRGSASDDGSPTTQHDSDSSGGFTESEQEQHDEVHSRNEEPSGPPETPPATPRAEELRRNCAVEAVDTLFRRAKLRLFGKPRWTKLFLNAAEQYEKRLDEKREQIYMAVAQDDLELLANVKKQVNEDLFNWWGYDLGLVSRASHRLKPKTLKLLPDLFGVPYPGMKKVSAVRASLDAEWGEGSSRSIAEMQRGMVLLKLLTKNFEDRSEINVDGPGGLQDVLKARDAGAWQDADFAAVGVNYGPTHRVYHGWRAIHFVAANCDAKETAIPALEMLFSAKADATLIDGGGATALHIACMRGHANVVNILLDNGCPLETDDLFGCSPINIAARCRHYPIIKTLTKFLVPENGHDALFHTEAERLATHYSLPNGHQLHVAVNRGNIETVLKLVALEPPDTANVNYADPSGRRAVHLAAGFISNEYVACDMLKILVGKKADVNARDANSETPLHIAARLGRAAVCKMLLLLHAHPNIPDFGNRTPLMLAAVGPDEERMPPAYNGVLTNRPLAWITIQDVLDWNGRGEPPIRNGPEPRKVRGPGAQRHRELMGQNKGKDTLPQVATRQKHRDDDDDDDDEGHHEQADDDEDHSSQGDHDGGYFTVNDCVTARAKALSELGFDDQRIIDTDGRVNRGDRMQLFHHLFQPSRTFVPKFPGDVAPLVPNDVRCRFLWKHLTGPLLQMECQGILGPRPSELLSYVLRVLLGKKGPAFGVLVSYGYDCRTLPLWTQIETTIKLPTLEKRLYTIMKTGFVGGKPKIQKWVGSKWDFDSYPREPIHAPWGTFSYTAPNGEHKTWKAFAYLDKDDKDHLPLVMLQKHAKYNQQLIPLKDRQTEAFKDNSFGVFEYVDPGSVATGTRSLPTRQDQLRLANMLYLNETAGVRQQVEPRTRIIGEKLICPLLLEIIHEIEEHGVAKDNKERQDLLDYMSVSLVHPKDTYVYVNQPRRPFRDFWEDVEDKAIKVLCREKDPIILSLGPKDDGGRVHHKRLQQKLKGVAKVVGTMAAGHTHELNDSIKKHREDVLHQNAQKSDLVTHQCAMPHQSLDEVTKDAPPGDYGQFALLHDDDKRWLLRAESTRAFVELKRSTCVRTCEEYSELIAAIAVGGLQDFHGRFWRAAFGLLLWGRARLLRDCLDAEIQRRLPKSRKYELKGPYVRPRSDVLGVCELAKEAKARLALHASEPPWLPKAEKDWLDPVGEVRPRLDFHAGKPDGGVKMPTGIALYSGFADIMYAQVLCDDANAMKKAFNALTGKPLGTKQLLRRNSFAGMTRGGADTSLFMSLLGKEGRTKFGVVRVKNSLREDQQKVIPLCASITLNCLIGWLPLGYGPPMEQIVEIEILLKATVQARWLAKYMDIRPDMMPRVRNEDEGWSPTARKKAIG